jgi:hypothetical protein
VKLTKPQQLVLDRAKNEPLFHGINNEGDVYYYRNGETVNSAMVKKLMSSGHIIPSGDGLFGVTQSYTTAPETPTGQLSLSIFGDWDETGKITPRT